MTCDDGDDRFLIYDSFDADKEHERILVFSSFGMRQRASAAVEIFADGTYRTASNTIATLYTIHTVIDRISFPIFFTLMPNEAEKTFVRAFEVVRPFMCSFIETCTAHVDCQLAAVNAIRSVFGCSIRICLSTRTKPCGDRFHDLGWPDITTTCTFQNSTFG